MALFSILNIKISGISSCVPKQVESNYDYNWISEKERKMLVKTTGVENRHVANKGVTTSDLCEQAAVKLLNQLKWDSKDIELLIFVSQSRDYFLPATAIILQDKLGLPTTAIALDISLGCSGYVYGLSTIASLMSTTKIKKALLLVGDISTFSLNKKDKSTYPLFGDAGTVTALEYDERAPQIDFNLQSDGSGSDAIIIPDGGLRNPLCEESYEEKEIASGIIRSNRNVALDGIEVFNFSLREVVPNIEELLKYNQSSKADYDYYVLHQGNKLMNNSLRKKLGVAESKVPYSLQEYGNTSSASIPLTIMHQLREKITTKKTKLILSGFGVGLSWGSAAIELNNIICPEIQEYE
jgi:3-oxoacyl-[acyl-carrier-protein] synthase-3